MTISRFRNFIDSRRAAAAIGQHRLPFRGIDVLRHRLPGSLAELKLADGDAERLGHEAWNILIGDCYRLREMLNRGVRSILDVGGNIGLFAAACRLRHPNAVIHSYEPNPDIRDLFVRNVSSFRCAPYPLAIGKADGYTQFTRAESSLDGRTHASEGSFGSNDGAVPTRSFASAVEALDGVDLLKLDCEGAEWDLFEVSDVWRRVRAITMEYHLWAKPTASESTLKALLSDLGYEIRTFEPSPNGPWGMLTAVRHGSRSVMPVIRQ
jgi:FkbM family methyltransferase